MKTNFNYFIIVFLEYFKVIFFSLGIYPIQLACWVFDHEKPLKITASGHLMPTGVDETCSITLLFSDQRVAQINISTNCVRFDRAFLVGDKGIIEVFKAK